MKDRLKGYFQRGLMTNTGIKRFAGAFSMRHKFRGYNSLCKIICRLKLTEISLILSLSTCYNSVPPKYAKLLYNNCLRHSYLIVHYKMRVRGIWHRA